MTALYSPVVTICTARSNIKSLHVIYKECLCNLALNNHNINWLVFALTTVFFVRYKFVIYTCILQIKQTSKVRYDGLNM